MKATLILLSGLFAFLFFRMYLRYRRLKKSYKNEYIKVLTSDEYKVKGRFE